MGVDRIMDYIKDDLIEDNGPESGGIHVDAPSAVPLSDLHPWCVGDIASLHSLLSAEDTAPIPSTEEINERVARNRKGVSTKATCDGKYSPESDYNLASRIHSLGWTKFHSNGSGRVINCGPSPPLASLFGRTMKKIREDFTAQGFEATFPDENNEIIATRFVARLWPGACDSTVIGSPIPSSPSSSDDSPSSSSHLRCEDDSSPDSSTAYSPSTSQDFVSVHTDSDSTAIQAEQEYSVGDQLEPPHLGPIRHQEVITKSDTPRSTSEPNPPSPSPSIHNSPLQSTGAAPGVTEYSVDDICATAKSQNSTLVLPETPLKQKPRHKTLARIASWRQEPSIKHFDPDPASGSFFRYQPPRKDDTARRESDAVEEITDSDIGFDENEQCFICRPCGKPFSRKNDVKRHLRMASSHKRERQSEGRRVGLKGVQCKYCGEVLSRPDACRRHEKVKACGKRAIRRPNGYNPVAEAIVW